MPINNNFINKIRYTLYSPIYDGIVKMLHHTRSESIASLELQADSKILIVGGGTGLDLALLPKDVEITATDLTPSMVKRMQKRSKKLGLKSNILVMDGQHLDFSDNSFDVVILHLILAVIPDPIAALKEAERVLKKGGRIAILDKFLPANQEAGFLRIFLNQFTKFMFSDINRKMEVMILQTKLEVVADIPADFGGIFRRIILRKP